jgi:hypothetical protein
MLNWFKRKKRTEAADKSEWAVATGEDAGFPLILRVRSTLPPGLDKSEYPTLLAIHWDYQPLANNGMPLPEERTRMEQLEDLVNDCLESKSQSYLTAVVTCNGVREWQWYTKDPQEAVSLINSALSEIAPFPIQISAQPDPEWSAYTGLAKSVE